MAAKSVTLWLDQEADYLEVMFDPEVPGFFRETPDDRMMVKVDRQGNILGFSVMRVSSLTSPASIDLMLHGLDDTP